MARIIKPLTDKEIRTAKADNFHSETATDYL